ncbi:HPF/RaiA family ribosome-associated protein [Colwelliaceae bacterium BS250]
MKIDIQNRLSEVEKSLEYDIQRRLRLALSKVAPYISSITFVISDSIGPDSKAEKHCSLTLSLYNMPNIVIEETQVDLYFVIDRVIQKATRSLSRKISS